MSIFSKKKQSQGTPTPPPMPPNGGLNDIKQEVSSSSGNLSNDSNKGMSGANSTDVSSSTPRSFNAPPSPSQSQQPSNKSAPPSPLGGQAPSQSTPSAQFSSMSWNQAGMSKNQQNPQSNQQSNSQSIMDDSLFNLEEFELPDLDSLDIETKNNPSQFEENQYNEIQTNQISKLSGDNEHSRRTLHLMDSDESKDFMPSHGIKSSRNDTYFLTTTEFKSLLEMIDSVKERVKTSTQRHMKITSIKSEEDIEFDNMKKDFQFIEEKLYEVDSTIFDR
ncbi:MAG: hypothetical protein ACLFPL_02570 [Candidatus Nanoarchaeia archaeon]